ncbi:thioredoxin family protein [Pontibacillus litoralis]|uniref:Thioredoxin n=1 Tax=Pontibacillus litoralis JSM 072002 TaxID=1385512 RepID=A0A0A5G7P0_9BACI|nr:thioredoxin family protein [Pontibacillus litoralis]KGX89156.1 thioredoxin [Pontibacillus litoralis JSM 072002]
MKTLQSMEQYEQWMQKGKVVFLFSADWCPDCRVIEPFLPEVEEKFDHYQFVYVDRDEFIDLCADLGVFGIPSFIVTEDGKELGRLVSKERKSQQQIEAFLESVSAS